MVTEFSEHRNDYPLIINSVLRKKNSIANNVEKPNLYLITITSSQSNLKSFCKNWVSDSNYDLKIPDCYKFS